MFENNEPFKRSEKILYMNCKGNWHMNICLAIEAAEYGDELLVMTHAQRELTIRAIERMKPGKNITCKLGAM